MSVIRTLNVDGHALPLIQGPPHACSYLPGRVARESYAAGAVSTALYARLMDMNFRRGGSIVYRPCCVGCSECVPIRVPVTEFAASRSQRRVLRKNADVEIAVRPPGDDDEHIALYARYQAQWHDGTMSSDAADYRSFIVDSPIRTIEMEYRSAGRLIGVGIVDVCPQSLSSVYFFFDPDEAQRSLGVYSGLCEIALARQWRKSHWYLGYYIRDCARMNYKSRFRPCELLGADGVWRRMESSAERAHQGE